MQYLARAYAKTNLFLDVVSKRTDGYHNINTVMQSLSIHDEISLELCEKGIAVLCDNNSIEGDENIAYSACKVFLDYAKIDVGVRITINKNIPVAAGLGGGSADAAAVLMLLNKATGKNFPVNELIPLAAKLGADVPFFLVGGTAKAEGIGEILTPLPHTELNIVLLKQKDKQSTGKMYGMLDSAESIIHGDFEAFLHSLNKGDLESLSNEIFNSFESCWDINDLFKDFTAYNPIKTFLSGSGPTVCALFKTESEAELCANALKADGNIAFYVRSMPIGVEIV